MHRKVNIYILAAVIVLLLMSFSGCATIIKGGSPQGVYFKSEPPDAKVTVIDLRNGNVISSTKAPQGVLLPKGSGYFKYGKYNATFEKEGYHKKEVYLEGDVNGWYVAGNIVFGGLIGWLIVDPLTGAMWSFDPEQISVLLNLKGVADPIGFNADEFKPPLSMEKLWAAISADKYEIKFKEPGNTIANLNEILEVPDLYDKLYNKDKLPKKGGDVSLPLDINDLKNQTADCRKAQVKFIGLNFDQQSKLRKLNRQLLEVAYPNETPKKQ